MRAFEPLEQRELLASDLSFDFGPIGQTVEQGSLAVDEFTFYGSQAYGWVGNVGTGTSLPGEQPDAGLADHVFGSGMIFRVDDLRPGTYDVTVQVKDDSPISMDVLAKSSDQSVTQGITRNANQTGSITFEIVVDENSGITKTPLTWNPTAEVYVEGTPVPVYPDNPGGMTLEFTGSTPLISEVQIVRTGSHLPTATLVDGTVKVNPDLSTVSMIVTAADLTITSSSDSVTFDAGTFTTIDAGLEMPVRVQVVDSGLAIANLDGNQMSLQAVHPDTLTFVAGSFDLDLAPTGLGIAIFHSTTGDDTYSVNSHTNIAVMNSNRVQAAQFTVGIGVGSGNDTANLIGNEITLGRNVVTVDGSHHVIGFDNVNVGVNADGVDDFFANLFYAEKRENLNYNLGNFLF